MKALVTGGAGFIGSHLVESLVNNGLEVVVVDDFSMGKMENLNGLDNVRIFDESVCNYEFMHSIVQNENFDYIFFLSAIASVADSVKRPLETHKVNNEAVLDLLEFIRSKHIKLKKFLFTSSAAVYGDSPELPKSETSTINPLSPYAIDKFSSEKYAAVYSDLYNIPTVCVRFFNVYGPNQNPESPYSGVLSIITDSLINGNHFTMYGDGEQTRDFIFVKDVIKALLLVLNKGKSGDVYNIANGQETSLNDLIVKYESVTKKKLVISYVDGRKGDIKRSVADVTKLSSLGYESEWSLEKGLKNYWDFLQRGKQ